jgi:hypothetical protein
MTPFSPRWLQPTLASPADSAGKQGNQEKHDEHQKKDLRDSCRSSGDAAEPQQRGNQGDDQKYECVVKHYLSPSIEADRGIGREAGPMTEPTLFLCQMPTVVAPLTLLIVVLTASRVSASPMPFELLPQIAVDH